MNQPISLKDHRLRVNLYGLLAILLARPPLDTTLELLEHIQTGALAEHEILMQGWRDLRRAAAICTADRLDEEFHRLFIGLGRGEVVPYGCWYLSGHLMDKPLARLRDDLAVLGIERRPATRETEDHVAALCESMALISDPEAAVPPHQQRQFFNTHLVAWMPHFFTDLQAAPSARFYRAVGRVGESFLAAEREFFNTAGPMPPRDFSDSRVRPAE